MVQVTLSDGEHVGRGEGGGVYYLGDTGDNMMATVERVRVEIENRPTR